VPIHWGTLRAIGSGRGADPRAPALAFAAEVAAKSLPIDVRILMPGEATTL
jgi:hypothetical protein